MKLLSNMTAMVIGLGQIGGSIGYDMRNRKIVSRVIGIDTNRAAIKRARASGAIDAGGTSWRRHMSRADLIILSAPIGHIVRMLPEIIVMMRPDQICLDVAGVKGELLDIVNQQPRRVNFIGGHPIAGTEKRGFAGAEPGIFRDTTFVLVPSTGSNRQAQIRAQQFVRRLGARAMKLTARDHDCKIAQTSHLPYAIAIALAHGIDRNVERPRPMVGGSLRSATRVALSSPELTFDMLAGNQAEVCKAIHQFAGDLKQLTKLLMDGDERRLKAFVKIAHDRAKRIHRESKPTRRRQVT